MSTDWQRQLQKTCPCRIPQTEENAITSALEKLTNETRICFSFAKYAAKFNWRLSAIKRNPKPHSLCTVRDPLICKQQCFARHSYGFIPCAALCKLHTFHNAEQRHGDIGDTNESTVERVAVWKDHRPQTVDIEYWRASLLASPLSKWIAILVHSMCGVCVSVSRLLN